MSGCHGVTASQQSLAKFFATHANAHAQTHAQTQQREH
jgi:hypothetical protein